MDAFKVEERLTFPADFRSDTVTRPTGAMRAAMASAEVGDDVLDGDPTVSALEAKGAAWLGKERALFVPSGTMANQIAMGVWTSPGDEVICESSCHILSFESGALGALHGVQTRTLEGVRGALDPGAVARAIRPDFVHCPVTSLVALEQTHMAAGGAVLPVESIDAVADVAHEAGIKLHIDGARLAHAVVASGVPAERIVKGADSVSLCLSKGLGAPVGSLIAGSEEFIGRALRVRKRLGGWMRQSGILAAAGLLALDDGPEGGLSCLEATHELARRVAARLDAEEGLGSDPQGVDTNLVLCEVDEAVHVGGAAALAEALGVHGVGVMALGPETLRFVTHRDLDETAFERLDGALTAILSPA